MIFYKNIFVSTILSVIILLVIVGVIMYNSKDTQIFPPILSFCPDYYNLDNGICVNTGIWNTANTECNNLNFNDPKYTVLGTGIDSGLCAKKTVATDCRITWDGITNNYSIC